MLKVFPRWVDEWRGGSEVTWFALFGVVAWEVDVDIRLAADGSLVPRGWGLPDIDERITQLPPMYPSIAILFLRGRIVEKLKHISCSKSNPLYS